MAKKEKEKSDILTLDDKQYEINEMSDEQKMMVAHLRDIQNKQSSNGFIADQLRVGHDAFVKMLKKSLESEEEVKED